jgi:phosphoribosylformylglycinamidine synthase
VYIVGKETEEEMGGSEYYNIIKIKGGFVPKTNINILKNCMQGILTAIDKKQIISCHDISEGGLGVCVSEMCIGGDIGAEINLSNLSKNLRSDFKLFSESNTRWIVEVEKEKQKDLEKTFKENNTPFVKIGVVKSNRLIIEDKGEKIIDQKISNLRDIWKNTIRNIMG